MKKVLIIAYYYPPLGGAGVQRLAKFVKYLPDHGYKVTVVAEMGRPAGMHTPLDNVLSKDVVKAKNYQIVLSRMEHFGQALSSHKLSKYLPFKSKWWEQATKRTCEQAIRDDKPDVIFVSVSPFFAICPARSVAMKYNLPWVLDMRDPWALDTITYYRTRLHWKLDLMAMKRACEAADAVIMNTPRSLQAVQEQFPQLQKEKLFCITNGYDQDDIGKREKINLAMTDCPLRIVHSGTFLTWLAIARDSASWKELNISRKYFDNPLRYCVGKPNLLARTPFYLFKAIKVLLDTGQLGLDDIRVIHAGTVTKADRLLIDRFSLQNIVQYTGHLSHLKSVALLHSADVLFLPLHEPANGKYPLLVPGKAYEYMGVRKPILGLLPSGDARDFVRKSGLGIVCEPTNIEQISRALLDLIAGHRSGKGLRVESNDEFIKQFDRKDLAARLAGVLDFAVDRRERAGLG